MNTLANPKLHLIAKWLLRITIIFVLLLLIYFVANIALASVYENKFLPGTKVASIDIGSLTLDQAKEKLNKRVDFMNRRGFVYVNGAKTVTIYPTLKSLEAADTSITIVDWQVNDTLQNLLEIEQSKHPSQFFNKLKIIYQGGEFPLGYFWQRGRNREILQENFKDVLVPMQEASFNFQNNEVVINPEKNGQTINYDQILNQTEQRIKNLLNEDIVVSIESDPAPVTASMIEGLKPQISAATEGGDLIIAIDEEHWTIGSNDWRQWLKVVNNKGKAQLSFDSEKIKTYFSSIGILAKAERPVQEAKFQLQDGRVAEFAPSQEGRTTNWSELVNILSDELAQGSKSKVFCTDCQLALPISKVEPQTSNQDVNDLGIVQLIGTGKSDFKGSPPNRIHNIGVGAKTLNGILIAPGEEFSLIKALGEIDGEHGYKQELVIKGNKTTPEFGGGLCQIGTTVFRGALATGLPILERRNHSYRVRYYEPAGTDATIYNPWPDLKFKNDTGKHILLQTRIEDTKLYLDFWGSDDGRIAQTTEPVIYNIVSPPERKLIKTVDLPVGKLKCTESAHSGADAKFTYSVQYPNEPDPREETFYSHYVPWQEVCLIGATEEEILAEQASSTDSGLPNP